MADTDQEIADTLASSPTAQGTSDIAPDAASPSPQTPPPAYDPTRWDSAVDSNAPGGEFEMTGQEPAAPSATPPGLHKVSVSTTTKTTKQNPALSTANTLVAPGQAEQVGAAELAGDQAAYGALDAANKRRAELDQKYYDGVARLQQQKADLIKWQAIKEQEAHEKSMADTHKYLQAYQDQLSIVRYLAAQDGNPIGKLGKGEMGLLTLANFAQGFLGAKYGIKIDVAGQVDRWVDREIQQQQQRVQNARAGAEDQLHLYEIARQTSRDDAEARERFKGMAIAGLDASMQSYATQFKSQSAMADYAAQSAQLKIEANKSARAIADKAYEHSLQSYQARDMSDFHHQQLLLEQQRVALERDRIAAAKDKGDKGVEWIADPEDPKSRKWAVDKSDKQAVQKALEAKSNAKIVDDALKDVQVAYDKAFGKWGQDTSIVNSLKALRSPEVREYIRAQKAATLAIAQHGPVKRINDKEINILLDQLPGESAWQRGNNHNAIAELREANRRNLESVMDTYSVEQTRGQRAMPNARSDYEARTAPAVSEEERGKQAVNAEMSDAVKVDTQHSTRATPFWKSHGAKFMSDEDASKDNTMPHPYQALEMLALGVHDPGKFRSYASANDLPLPDSDEAVAKECREALQHTAHMPVPTDLASNHKQTDEDKQRHNSRAYAAYLLGKVDDPDFAKQLAGEE